MRSRNHRPSSGSFRPPREPLKAVKDLRMESIEELHDEYDVQDLQDLKELIETGFDLQQVHGVGPSTEENIIEKLVYVKGLDSKFLEEVKK